jgi:6-pyruvoyltetrahydropterin/6-carboxytetrahydropterin synthase
MIIEKKYHFYAAHRNELLNDKCYNLHGHVYRFKVYVETSINERGATILFNDIDKYVKPIIDSFDHGCFVHVEDKKLMHALEILGTKKYILDAPSSTEVIAQSIFNILKNSGLPVVRIDLMETESSTIIYQP